MPQMPQKKQVFNQDKKALIYPLTKGLSIGFSDEK